MEEQDFLKLVEQLGFSEVEGRETETDIFNVRIADNGRYLFLTQGSGGREKMYSLEDFTLVKYNNYMDREDVYIAKGYNDITTISMLERERRFLGLIYKQRIFTRELQNKL